MKISDDYRAKVRLWARQPAVVPLPASPPLPKFTAQKFRTHEEMNQWKWSLGTTVSCLSGPHLLAAKRAANRPQDQAYIEFLTELQRLGKL